MRGLGQKDITFLLVFFLREREGERGEEGKERFQVSLRSSDFCWSEFVEPIVKVHILNKGYTWVPKRWGLAEDLKEDISINKGFGVK